MHCLTVAYEGATPVWHRRGGGDPLPPFTTDVDKILSKEVQPLLTLFGQSQGLETQDI